jgi:hypothetical protein
LCGIPLDDFRVERQRLRVVAHVAHDRRQGRRREHALFQPTGRRAAFIRVHEVSDGEIRAVLSELQQAERDSQTGLRDGIRSLTRSCRFDRLDRGVDTGSVIDILGVNRQQLEMNRIGGIRHQFHAGKRGRACIAVELEHRVALRLDREQCGDVRRLRIGRLVRELELRSHLRQGRGCVASGQCLQAFYHRVRVRKTRGLRNARDPETREREQHA